MAAGELRTFVGVLLHTGCCISETLALTADRVDLREGVIVFESLKKRKRGVYRAVPVPPKLLDELQLVHRTRDTENRRGRGRKIPLWSMSRATAWRRIKALLQQARRSAQILLVSAVADAYMLRQAQPSVETALQVRLYAVLGGDATPIS